MQGKDTKWQNKWSNFSDDADIECLLSDAVVNEPSLDNDEQRQIEPIKDFVPTPEAKYMPPKDMIPLALLVVKSIQGQLSLRLLWVLFDSGGTKTMINQCCLPKGAIPSKSGVSKILRTIVGEFRSQRYVHMQHLVLLEFNKNKRINNIDAMVLNGSCSYDVILGWDFLSATGIKLNFETNSMSWLGIQLPMKPPSSIDEEKDTMIAHLLCDKDSELGLKLDQFLVDISKPNYGAVNVWDVAQRQKHLTAKQCQQLAKFLFKHKKCFDDTLRRYPHCKVHMQPSTSIT